MYRCCLLNRRVLPARKIWGTRWSKSRRWFQSGRTWISDGFGWYDDKSPGTFQQLWPRRGRWIPSWTTQQRGKWCRERGPGKKNFRTCKEKLIKTRKRMSWIAGFPVQVPYLLFKLCTLYLPKSSSCHESSASEYKNSVNQSQGQKQFVEQCHGARHHFDGQTSQCISYQPKSSHHAYDNSRGEKSHIGEECIMVHGMPTDF